ncbi:NAD(P)H-dependent oxidoreductase [Shewanella sp. AS16]|uniref:NADPH-dependent FMN reductase n=1 Tax=Shewanella sp. AS16 TaxID=2907625 RepID=UPI001F2BE1AA|nr:NAD(P)H-dependent oxidoreductase [Shewanella sp. AS16]MCE9684634.1 NAD(P)H-dependent oxidoreductase [Shewanella sp. AS16]
MAELNVIAISGSLRQGSYNSATLRAAQTLAPAGMKIEIADISDIPIYNQDIKDKGIPKSVEALVAQVLAADAILFATPEYNYSVSGVLKNCIDWLSRCNPMPLADKPAAIVSASIGRFGGARAQYDLRRILIYLDVHFVNKPEVMIASAGTHFDADGHLIDVDTREHLARLLQSLAAWTERLQATKPSR